MTKFHCKNCDTINEVEPEHDAENEVKYQEMVAQEVIAREARLECLRVEARKLGEHRRLIACINKRFQEIYYGKKIKNFDKAMVKFLEDRYPDIYDDFMERGYNYSLTWGRLISCESLGNIDVYTPSNEIKWNYTLTCPTCLYVKKFWRVVDNTED